MILVKRTVFLHDTTTLSPNPSWSGLSTLLLQQFLWKAGTAQAQRGKEGGGAVAPASVGTRVAGYLYNQKKFQGTAL